VQRWQSEPTRDVMRTLVLLTQVLEFHCNQCRALYGSIFSHHPNLEIRLTLKVKNNRLALFSELIAQDNWEN
jgi:hypothetical protein